MSDPNAKTASILLKKEGKTDAFFLYDLPSFPGKKRTRDATASRSMAAGTARTESTRPCQPTPW